MSTKPHILQWVALWFLAVLLSAMLYSATASAQIASGGRGQVQQVYKCQRKLASLANTSQMSRTTAKRIALKLCKQLKNGTTEERYYFRVMTTR